MGLDGDASCAYAGWSDAEIAVDRALAGSIRALGQADGLLDPALDGVFARRPVTRARRFRPKAAQSTASAGRADAESLVAPRTVE
jgi:hypothetical protein